jgi:hypothetical protein
MKPIRFLMCALVMGALTFITSKASAFPLTLKSLNGTITSTAVAGTSSTATKYSVILKKLMLVVSNEVVQNGGPTPPANAVIAVDPYQYDSVHGFQVFLTNSAGYFYNLSTNNLAYFTINDMATTFKNNANGGTESDTINAELDIFGYDSGGQYFEFDVIGNGKFSASTTGKTGLVKITFSLANGAGRGLYQDSDDGVAGGGFGLQGSGTAPVAGPYSTWWYNNILF